MGRLTISNHLVHPDGTESWTEKRKDPEGTYSRKVTAKPWKFERTQCFCCSCEDTGRSDPHCRNHGFDGTRPCEVHEMPGGMTDTGVMPESVQEHNASRARGRKKEWH